MRRLLPIFVVVLALVVPTTAQAFDPATQSHPGACSETTVHVHKAVGDLHANEVLESYVDVLGIDTASKSMVKAAEEELVVVKLHQAATAANHGCEEGVVFPIGQRRLHAGEKVGIRVSRKLRAELCSGPGKDCVARRLKEKVVLPINCWNIEEGKFVVVVYVHKPPPSKPPASRALPSASAQLSCDAGAVVVDLSNEQTATASATFEVNGDEHGPVAPGGELTVKVPVAAGKSVKVTITSGSLTLIEHVYTSHCGAHATPTPAPNPVVSHPVTPKALPAAAMTVVCGFTAPDFGGEAFVTLYNSTKATQAASFEVIVNGAAGTDYGPLKPGQIMTTPPILLPFGEDLEVEVFSGGSLVFEEFIFSPCEGG